MYDDQQDAINKLNAYQREQTAAVGSGQLAGTGALSYGDALKSSYSPAELLQKQAHHQMEMAEKSQRAANFLNAHPEFVEFINLWREGILNF